MYRKQVKEEMWVFVYVLYNMLKSPSSLAADVEGLKPNRGTLSLLINDHGGIIDDLIINQTSEDHIFIVSNAGCAAKDQAHIKVNSLQSWCMAWVFCKNMKSVGLFP